MFTTICGIQNRCVKGSCQFPYIPYYTVLGLDRAAFGDLHLRNCQNATTTQVMVTGRHTATVNIYNGAPWKPLGIILCQPVLPWRKLDTIKDVKRRIDIAKIASGDLHMIWRNIVPIPLKRKLVQ